MASGGEFEDLMVEEECAFLDRDHVQMFKNGKGRKGVVTSKRRSGHRDPHISKIGWCCIRCSGSRSRMKSLSRLQKQEDRWQKNHIVLDTFVDLKTLFVRF